MASLQALEEDTDAFCRAQALALADAAAGRTSLADMGAVERAHPEVVSRDTVAALAAAAESPRTPDAQRPRLLALLPFLRRAALEAAARPALDALQAARAASTVQAAGTQRPLLGAWAAVAEEANTARRAALALASAETELLLLGAVQRRFEALHAAGRGLHEAAPVPLALQAEAADFLKATEDAWRDVLAFACRKLESHLRPLPHGDAGLQELLRLAHTPLPGVFPGQERLRVLRRWLAEAGLPLEAEGRLRVEEDAGAHVSESSYFAVQVPERILLVLPADGRGGFPAFLDAAGRARAAASVSPSASLGARRLGDRAVRASAGFLFRGVLTSPSWLRRFLGLGRNEAREVARLCALAQLGELRMLAARLPFLGTSGDVEPSLARLTTLANATSEALFLDVPVGALLPALASWPTEVDTLRAAALAECLKAKADERFDAEDFRNPSAARWLASVWARGSDVDADTHAAELGGRLSLLEVGRRLTTALGA
jgi:hypothetical protein